MLRSVRFGLGLWEVDLAVGTAVQSDKLVTLTPMECALLDRLRSTDGEPVSRSVLLQQVWGYAPQVRSRTVDTTLQRLRLKLESDPDAPALLHTVRGVGIVLSGVRAAREGVAPQRLVRRALPEPLVGRTAALQAVVAGLDAGNVVLVGPPGVGKSAVARAVAARLDDGARAVLHVDVTGLASLSDVERALGRVVDGGRADTEAHTLIGQLDRPVLILDAAESLASVTVEALASWPATLLFTSRRVLPGACVRLGPLPRAEADALADDVAKRRGVTLQDADRDALWAQTAGLPQALLLAVPIVEVVGSALVVSDWLDLKPAGGDSLRETLAIALGSLSESAQHLLRGLAAFEHTFDVEAVRAVHPQGVRELIDLHQRGLIEGRQAMQLLRPIRAVLPVDSQAQQRVYAWLGALGQRDLLGLTRARQQRGDLIRGAQQASDVRGLAWTLRGAGREVGLGADVIDALVVAKNRAPEDPWVEASLATAQYLRVGTVPASVPEGVAGLWVRALVTRNDERAAVVAEAPARVLAADLPDAWKAEMLADIHARDSDTQRGVVALEAVRQRYRDLPVFYDRLGGLLALLALGTGQVGRAQALLADRLPGETPWWPVIEGFVASEGRDLAVADDAFGRAAQGFAELGDLRGLASSRTLRALVRWINGESFEFDREPLPPGLDSVRRFLTDPHHVPLQALRDPDARALVAAWRAGQPGPDAVRGWPMRMLRLALQLRSD